MGGEEMTHACGFGLEVVLGVRVGADNDGDAILDDNVEGAESLDLAWIIRHKLHTVDATIFENVWHTGILTSVAFEAELRVGINGVDPVLLQRVS